MQCSHSNGFGGSAGCDGGKACSGKRSGAGNSDGQPNGGSLNGVCGDNDDQSAGGDGDAAFGEEFTQSFNGAADPLLRGIVGCADGLADFAQGFIFEVAEQDGRAISFVERVHGFIKQRFNVLPIFGGGVDGIHFRGNLFTQLPAGFAADHINGLAARDLIKPRGYDGIRRELVRVAGELEEGGLGNFFRQLRGADLPESGRMDQVEMAVDDFSEGVLGVSPGVTREQFQIGLTHLHKDNVSPERNPTKNLQVKRLSGTFQIGQNSGIRRLIREIARKPVVHLHAIFASACSRPMSTGSSILRSWPSGHRVALAGNGRMATKSR